MNHIGLKVACLVVAMLVWVQVASNQDVERTIFLPLELVNLQPGMTVAGSRIPANVLVRLRGSKLRLIAHRYLGQRAGRVVVDLADMTPGTTQRPLTVNDVRSALDVVEVRAQHPLSIQIDRLVSRAVPVVVTTSGQLPSGRMLVGALSAAPDSVVLSGPSRLFVPDLTIRTEPLDLSRQREAQTVRRRLASPSPHLTPAVAEVAVRVPVSLVDRRTLSNVPIVPLVDANQPEVTVYPPVADLAVSGPADSVRALLPSRVAVTVSLSGLPEGIHHLRGQVILPEGFTLLSLEPEEFMAIIGEADDVGAGERGP
jgi:YbbR domain-containing protein